MQLPETEIHPLNLHKQKKKRSLTLSNQISVWQQKCDMIQDHAELLALEWNYTDLLTVTLREIHYPAADPRQGNKRASTSMPQF
jgi:hypothetical protein